LARKVMDAEIGAIQTNFLCGDSQVNRLQQSIARGTGLIGGMVGPVPE